MINATGVVTKDRSTLGETIMIGLPAVKEAVRFHDPVNGKPENIPITKEPEAICPLSSRYISGKNGGGKASRGEKKRRS